MESTTLLTHAKNYREFMRLVIEGTAGFKARSYAAISKKAGFASRSLVRDIVIGKRRITAKTLLPICAGLGLRGELKTYFKLLVLREESDLRAPEMNKESIIKKIALAKTKIEKRSSHAVVSNQLLSKSTWVEIYAALGTVENGASLSEVANRTGRPSKQIEEELIQMCDHGFAKKDEPLGRYLPLNPHVVFQSSTELHRKFFLDSARAMVGRAQTDFSKPERLYWKSVFSVRQEKALHFKQELLDLMLRFVDHAEVPEGNTLGHLLVSFETDLSKSATT